MMKLVRIKTYEKGLLFKNGALDKVLNAGWHLVWSHQELFIYNTAQKFYSHTDWSVLKQNKDLLSQLEVIEVGDTELVLCYKDGRFQELLEKGRHIYWKGIQDLRFDRYDTADLELPQALQKQLTSIAILRTKIRLYEVQSYEKALLFVNDAYVRTLGGGVYAFWQNVNSIRLEMADMRRQLLEVSGQELLTQDKAAVRINFDLSYRIAQVEKALLENKHFEKQLYNIMQLALRAYVGELSLDALLQKRNELADALMKEVAAKANQLGVQVLDAGIRDVILPGEVREIMNKVLVAQKTAEANTILRREETAATRSLLNSAKLMEENDMLFRLKEMEYMEKIADRIGEITLSGNGGMLQELRGIFSTAK